MRKSPFERFFEVLFFLEKQDLLFKIFGSAQKYKNVKAISIVKFKALSTNFMVKGYCNILDRSYGV
jgi:hypothetical protein